MVDRVAPIKAAPLHRTVDDAVARLHAPQRRTQTILVVDDEPRVLGAVRSILTRNGYLVLEAQNVTDALLICKKHPVPIDLLLADIMLGRTTGPQLAARLLIERPDMALLYMSGQPATSMLASAVLASGARLFQKPITPALLIQHVRDVLGTASEPAPS